MGSMATQESGRHRRQCRSDAGDPRDVRITALQKTLGRRFGVAAASSGQALLHSARINARPWSACPAWRPPETYHGKNFGHAALKIVT
jgi:hypothetical protein